jgi:hypothetical protein
MGLGDMSQYR